MVAHERVGDVPDVAREVYEDGEERPQLYDGDCRRQLLRVESFGEPRETRREDKVRGRADGYELREPLHDAEYDCLKYVHVVVFSEELSRPLLISSALPAHMPGRPTHPKARARRRQSFGSISSDFSCLRRLDINLSKSIGTKKPRTKNMLAAKPMMRIAGTQMPLIISPMTLAPNHSATAPIAPPSRT